VRRKLGKAEYNILKDVLTEDSSRVRYILKKEYIDTVVSPVLAKIKNNVDLSNHQTNFELLTSNEFGTNIGSGLSPNYRNIFVFVNSNRLSSKSFMPQLSDSDDYYFFKFNTNLHTNASLNLFNSELGKTNANFTLTKQVENSLNTAHQDR
jgi:hypothetical protein